MRISAYACVQTDNSRIKSVPVFSTYILKRPCSGFAGRSGSLVFAYSPVCRTLPFYNLKFVFGPRNSLLPCTDCDEYVTAHAAWPLRKHAYSNILKILPPKRMKIFRKQNYDVFHISAQNIDCGYSLEPPRRGGSDEYPQPQTLEQKYEKYHITGIL